MTNQEEIEKLADAVEAEPADPNNHVELGNYYYGQFRYQEAKGCYQKAIELDPNVSVYYENLGLAHEELIEWKEAIDVY